jgi:hypothetical protein
MQNSFLPTGKVENFYTNPDLLKNWYSNYQPFTSSQYNDHVKNGFNHGYPYAQSDLSNSPPTYPHQTPVCFPKAYYLPPNYNTSHDHLYYPIEQQQNHYAQLQQEQSPVYTNEYSTADIKFSIDHHLNYPYYAENELTNRTKQSSPINDANDNQFNAKNLTVHRRQTYKDNRAAPYQTTRPTIKRNYNIDSLSPVYLNNNVNNNLSNITSKTSDLSSNEHSPDASFIASENLKSENFFNHQSANVHNNHSLASSTTSSSIALSTSGSSSA